MKKNELKIFTKEIKLHLDTLEKLLNNGKFDKVNMLLELNLAKGLLETMEYFGKNRK